MQWGSQWLPNELWECILRYIPQQQAIPVLQTCKNMQQFALERVWRPGDPRRDAAGLRWACAFNFFSYWKQHFDARDSQRWDMETRCNIVRCALKFADDAFLERVIADVAQEQVFTCSCPLVCIKSMGEDLRFVERLLSVPRFNNNPLLVIQYCITERLTRALEWLLNQHLLQEDQMQTLVFAYEIQCAVNHIDAQVKIRDLLQKTRSHSRRNRRKKRKTQV